MQPIQDKDFDKLFKNAFEEAEISPSRDLWSNIESEIEPKRKRIIPIYWLSAAAVLLIATVGFLIFKQQEIKPKQFANNVEPKVIKPVVETQPVADSAKAITVKTPLPVLRNSSKPVEAFAKVKVTNQPSEKQKVVTAPEMQKQEIMIAQVDKPKEDIKAKIENAVAKVNQETVFAAAATVVKADDVTGEDNQAENKGIRNVGDVVNLIVNKVDKRKDKFIQFRTDDDDSSLSSINIGPFKIGKRNRK